MQRYVYDNKQLAKNRAKTFTLISLQGKCYYNNKGLLKIYLKMKFFYNVRNDNLLF